MDLFLHLAELATIARPLGSVHRTAILTPAVRPERRHEHSLRCAFPSAGYTGDCQIRNIACSG